MIVSSVFAARVWPSLVGKPCHGLSCSHYLRQVVAWRWTWHPSGSCLCSARHWESSLASAGISSSNCPGRYLTGSA